MPRLTADALRLTREERKALRRAGLTVADVVRLTPGAIVAATGEVVSDERVADIAGAASLIALGISPGFVHGELRDQGLRSANDLAARNPDEMFVTLLATTSRTNPIFHDLFARSIALARGERPPSRARDPLLLYWRHVHGPDVGLPRPTPRRLRLPTIGVNARVCEGDLDAHGRLVMPATQHDVVVRDALVLGHWMWNGGHGAFVRLEDLVRGDLVELGGERLVVASVDMVADAADLSGSALVLATPPHRRVWTIGRPEDLKPVERGTLQVVVRAEPPGRAKVDATPRPRRRIGGAY